MVVVTAILVIAGLLAFFSLWHVSPQKEGPPPSQPQAPVADAAAPAAKDSEPILDAPSVTPSEVPADPPDLSGESIRVGVTSAEQPGRLRTIGAGRYEFAGIDTNGRVRTKAIVVAGNQPELRLSAAEVLQGS
jgi:hypothetical protein